MEECDRYQVLRWNERYKFLGREFEDRIQEFLALHNGKVPNFKMLTVEQ